MVKEQRHGQMALFLLGNSLKAGKQVKVRTNGQMGIPMKETGETTSKMVKEHSFGEKMAELTVVTGRWA